MTMFVDVQPGQFGYSDIFRGTGMAKPHLFLYELVNREVLRGKQEEHQ
jgi:hypothetical protein